MQFRISDTFTSSLGRLTNEEQKQVKTTVFDLQLNPNNPGMQFHRIDKSKDVNFWSIRAGRDIRIIVHKTNDSFLICYVDHHDKAYDWAERRKIEEHPKTGAAQIVEVRELVKEVFVQKIIEENKSNIKQALLFEGVPDVEFLNYGVPEEWIADVKIATEDTLFKILEHLPQEASEALLELAIGGDPVKQKMDKNVAPFEHPDAKRRFSIIHTSEELQKALDAPWDKWTVFLHPDQRKLVEQKCSGPYRVSGSAGTGKTIVALHRAVFLLKANPESRVLLTTFSETLANSLRDRLKKLLVGSPMLGDRIDIFSFDEVALNLYSKLKTKRSIISQDKIIDLIEGERKNSTDLQISTAYLASEWIDVIDAWEVNTWEEYKNAKRLGRRKRLSDIQKQKVWEIFSNIKKYMDREGLITKNEVLNVLSREITKFKNPPYTNIVIDEAQDISICQLRLIAALGASQVNGLFFAGDLGQRIFQQPFSWKALGVEIRGRSKTLKVNYRTSHQIRIKADGLLPEEISDVDQNKENRQSTISVFDGTKPIVLSLKSIDEEKKAVSNEILNQIKLGVRPEEIGIFVRTDNEIKRAEDIIKESKLSAHILNDRMNTLYNNVSIGIMHLAKGLEFKAVFVIACDDEVIPNQSRLETAIDEADLEEIYQTERHLLYVACTRARDFLMVTGVNPSSEFLQDLEATKAK